MIGRPDRRIAECSTEPIAEPGEVRDYRFLNQQSGPR
jgi:hypothetical protein